MLNDFHIFFSSNNDSIMSTSPRDLKDKRRKRVPKQVKAASTTSSPESKKSATKSTVTVTSTGGKDKVCPFGLIASV
jgi:hypothetical protein